MLYSGIHYINSKISPKNVRYKRSTKVARARKVVERSLLSSKGPEAPVLHEGRARARARARAKYPGHFRPAKKRPHQWIFEFFLRDWQELDEILPTIATKNQKFEENLRKKFNWKSLFLMKIFNILLHFNLQKHRIYSRKCKMIEITQW